MPILRHPLAFALALAAAVLPSAGCTASLPSGAGTSLRECYGFDAPLSRLKFHSRKELYARIVTWKLDQEFPITVETTSTSLVLTGFTPSGRKSYTLVRRGDDVEVKHLSPGAAAVPPRNIMEDVMAMSMPSQCALGNLKNAVSLTGGWEIRDTCADGRPTTRRIGHPGAAPEIEITYAKNAVLVKQNRCRYGARYVLRLSAPRR
jgi:hypothetical protein